MFLSYHQKNILIIIFFSDQLIIHKSLASSNYLNFDIFDIKIITDFICFYNFNCKISRTIK